MEDREGQGAEERRPGHHVCLAKGFTVPQQHPTAGSSSGQDRKGAQGERQCWGPLGGGMGVECGGSGLDTNSSLLTAGNTLEG